MRSGQLLAVAGITSAFLVAASGACGGSSTATSSDSGATSDVGAPDSPAESASNTTGGGSDASAASDGDAADALPLICQIDASLSQVSAPDASADASLGDSGLSLTGCLSCIQTSCPTQVSACEADCTCKVNVQNFVACVGSGMTSAMCESMLLGTADAATASLIGCLLAQPCVLTACGV